MAKHRKPHIPDFDKFAKSVQREALKAAEAKLTEIAGQEAELFKKRIKDQDFESFEHFPLTPEHVARKRRLGLPELTMIATGKYLKSIKVFKQDDPINKNTRQVIISIDPSEKAKNMETGRLRDDVTLQEVARIHEYGAPKSNIPARRHWGVYTDGLRARSDKLCRSVAKAVGAALAARFKR